tara:strand:+ start:10163 stop:10750 length:588 start_codon:yes stop_codon:yes gene_type:complete
MSKETSKSEPYRRLQNDFELYLHGKGLDIGGGPDPLVVDNGSVDVWDLANGDATYLNGIDDNKYDFVYSSHCLEHLNDIEVAIKNWSRVLKRYGYLYITIPDFALYEKCQFPSVFGAGPHGHTTTFSLDINRSTVNRSTHFNILTDFRELLERNAINLIDVRLELGGYNFIIPNSVDQTLGNAQIQICVIGKRIV